MAWEESDGVLEKALMAWLKRERFGLGKEVKTRLVWFGEEEREA